MAFQPANLFDTPPAPAAPAPQANSRLNETCILIDMSISYFTGLKKDKQQTTKTNHDAGAEDGAANVSKKLLKCTELDDVRKARAAIRDENNLLTLPWSNNGTRILPAAIMLEYQTRINRKIAAFDSAVNAFLQRYNQLITDEPARLGALYNPDDYLTVQQMAKRFKVNYTFLPMPEVSDFRVKLADGERELLQQQLQNKITTAHEAVTKATTHRLYEAVRRLAEILEKGRLHEGRLTDLDDLLRVLPALNATGNPALAELINQTTKKLGNLPYTELKDDKTSRANAAQIAKEQAEEIKKKMAAYIGIMGAQDDDGDDD